MTVAISFQREDIALYKAVAFIPVATFAAKKTRDTMTKWAANGVGSNRILDE